MSATFISRGKAALVCCIAALALAFGMAAIATTDAHAVTVKNGAKYTTIHFLEPVVFDVDGDKTKESVVFTWDKDMGIVRYAVNEGHHVWGDFFQTAIGCEKGEDYDGNFTGYEYKTRYKDAIVESNPDSYTMRLITLKNGQNYLYLKSKKVCDPWNFDKWWCALESLNNIGTGESVYISAFHYGVKSASVSKVDGNSIYFNYTHSDKFDTDYDNPTGGAFRTYYSISFPLKYTYSSTTKNLKLSSTSATPTKTTTWRKVCGMDAYKYSSCSTYKFKIKNNAKVQLKKVSVKYAPWGAPRYYVKTTSGKYGWIFGKDYRRGGA